MDRKLDVFLRTARERERGVGGGTSTGMYMGGMGDGIALWIYSAMWHTRIKTILKCHIRSRPHNKYMQNLHLLLSHIAQRSVYEARKQICKHTHAHPFHIIYGIEWVLLYNKDRNLEGFSFCKYCSILMRGHENIQTSFHICRYLLAHIYTYTKIVY